MIDDQQKTKIFNIDEYQECLTGDAYRKDQLRKLADNHRMLKSIQYENFGILKSLSDTEHTKKLLDVVIKVWGGVLEANTESLSIDEIVSRTLVSEEVIKFLNEHRNKPHFQSDKVFDSYIDNTMQRKLVKGKYMGKREAKKQKTPMQTINYVYNAKTSSDKSDRMQKIEKSLEEAHYMISLLAVSYNDLGVHMEHNSNEIKEVRARLSAVEKQVKDSRKLKLYAIYTSNKKLTYQEMANEIGISLRTVKYWIQEMKDQGLIS